jgi:Tfp pilus assembly protein PilP
MRTLPAAIRIRLAQVPSRWLPVLTWTLFVALLLGEQWAETQRVTLQKTLDKNVAALQQQQRQQHEQILLETGIAPYLNARQSGEVEERIRQLATQQGLQLQQLEQTDPNRSTQRRDGASSTQNRLVFQGSLAQITRTLQDLAVQLDPEHILRLHLQLPPSATDGRRLQLTLATQTQDPAAVRQTSQAFWQWLKNQPLHTTLGARNPFQLERGAIVNSAATETSPLTELELNAVLLVGTLLDPQRGQSRALFLLPDNQVVSARIGDAVGRERARILAILPDAVDLVLHHRDSNTATLRREHQRLTVHSSPIGSAP